MKIEPISIYQRRSFVCFVMLKPPKPQHPLPCLWYLGKSLDEYKCTKLFHNVLTFSGKVIEY